MSRHVWFQQSRSFACDFGTHLIWEAQISVIYFLYLNKDSLIFNKKRITLPPCSSLAVVFRLQELLLKPGILSVIYSVVLRHPVPLDHPSYSSSRGVTHRALVWSHMHPVFTAAHTKTKATQDLCSAHSHSDTLLQSCKCTQHANRPCFAAFSLWIFVFQGCPLKKTSTKSLL